MEKEETTEQIVLKGKIEEVKNNLLHVNWLGWYERRKGISKELDVTNSRIMLNGLVEDFYSVTRHLEESNSKLREEVEELKGGLRDLLELQNGAPLIRHEKEFNKVESNCWELLTKNN